MSCSSQLLILNWKTVQIAATHPVTEGGFILVSRCLVFTVTTPMITATMCVTIPTPWFASLGVKFHCIEWFSRLLC